MFMGILKYCIFMLLFENSEYLIYEQLRRFVLLDAYRKIALIAQLSMWQMIDRN